MSQFFVPDIDSAGRCNASRDERRPTTVSGVDVIDAQVKLFTGIVQSVEDHGKSASLLI